MTGAVELPGQLSIDDALGDVMPIGMLPDPPYEPKGPEDALDPDVRGDYSTRMGDRYLPHSGGKAQSSAVAGGAGGGIAFLSAPSEAGLNFRATPVAENGATVLPLDAGLSWGDDVSIVPSSYGGNALRVNVSGVYAIRVALDLRMADRVSTPPPPSAGYVDVRLHGERTIIDPESGELTFGSTYAAAFAAGVLSRWNGSYWFTLPILTGTEFRITIQNLTDVTSLQVGMGMGVEFQRYI